MVCWFSSSPTQLIYEKIIFTSLATLILALSAPSAVAADTNTNQTDFATEVTAVTAQLKAKFDAGKTTDADLAENLQAINDLITKHQKDRDREQLARLYLLDAHIHADGLKQSAKARAIWAYVAANFPGALAARGASLSMSRLDAQLAADSGPQVPEGLALGQKFPVFDETSLGGQPLSVAANRGKVTLIDFWAAWCPPCRAELPNVTAIYRTYHAQGFDIVGISLDDDREALVSFTQARGMAWPQYFDGKGWDNKLAKKYGVQSIPMTYLLDRHGIIIGKELRGEELGPAVVKALAAN
jgi:thiol-disulfide isomerase/thioredoxin